MPQEPTGQISLDDFEEQARNKYGVPKGLWESLKSQESGGDIDAKSPTGVRGRFQVTKATAAEYGLDRDDPFHQAVAAAKHLRSGYDKYGHIKDDNQRWLAAAGRYYGGDDAVDKDGNLSDRSLDGLSNPQKYVTGIATKWGEYNRKQQQPQTDNRSLIAVGHSKDSSLQQPANPPEARGRSNSTPRISKSIQPSSKPPAPLSAQQDVFGRPSLGTQLEKDLADPNAGKVSPRVAEAERVRNLPALQRAKYELGTAAKRGMLGIVEQGQNIDDLISDPLTAIPQAAEAVGRTALQGLRGNPSFTGLIPNQEPAINRIQQERRQRIAGRMNAGQAGSAQELEDIKQQVAAREEASPTLPAKIVRGVGSGLIAGAPQILAGNVPGAVAATALGSDPTNPGELATNIAGAVLPVKASRMAAPLVERTAQAVPKIAPLVRGSAPVVVGAGTNVGQRAAMGETDPEALAEAAAVGGAMSLADAYRAGRMGQPLNAPRPSAPVMSAPPLMNRPSRTRPTTITSLPESARLGRQEAQAIADPAARQAALQDVERAYGGRETALTDEQMTMITERARELGNDRRRVDQALRAQQRQPMEPRPRPAFLGQQADAPRRPRIPIEPRQAPPSAGPEQRFNRPMVMEERTQPPQTRGPEPPFIEPAERDRPPGQGREQVLQKYPEPVIERRSTLPGQGDEYAPTRPELRRRPEPVPPPWLRPKMGPPPIDRTPPSALPEPTGPLMEEPPTPAPRRREPIIEERSRPPVDTKTPVAPPVLKSTNDIQEPVRRNTAETQRPATETPLRQAPTVDARREAAPKVPTASRTSNRQRATEEAVTPAPSRRQPIAQQPIDRSIQARLDWIQRATPDQLDRSIAQLERAIPGMALDVAGRQRQVLKAANERRRELTKEGELAPKFPDRPLAESTRLNKGAMQQMEGMGAEERAVYQPTEEGRQAVQTARNRRIRDAKVAANQAARSATPEPAQPSSSVEATAARSDLTETPPARTEPAPNMNMSERDTATVKFTHARFPGVELVKSENQKGVVKGKVRVTDPTTGKEHVIKDPYKAGNREAAPARAKKPTEAEKSALGKMYHGTSSPTPFDAPKGKSWFTSDPAFASDYAAGAHVGGAEGPQRIYPASLSIKKPYRVKDRLEQIEIVNDPDRVADLERKGYDGIIRTDEDGKVIALPFKDKQISSPYRQPRTKKEAAPPTEPLSVKPSVKEAAPATTVADAVRTLKPQGGPASIADLRAKGVSDAEIQRALDNRELSPVRTSIKDYRQMHGEEKTKADLLDGVIGVEVARGKRAGAQKQPDVVAGMRQVEPQVDTGAPVSLTDLRAKMKGQFPTKEAFDKAILEMAERGDIRLQRHVFPDSLSEAERANLVLGKGFDVDTQKTVPAYYIGANLSEKLQGQAKTQPSARQTAKAKPKFVEDAEQRLKEAASGKRAGSGAQALIDQAIVTGHQIYRAGMTFADWSAQVVKQAGEKVRPHLRAVWDQLNERVTFGPDPRTREGVENSRPFKRWFGDSKVVDEQGKPKVVYHSTQGDFDTFRDTADVGFHFGTAKAANDRAETPTYFKNYGSQPYRDRSSVMPAYLSIKNPLKVGDVFSTSTDTLERLIELGHIDANDPNFANIKTALRKGEIDSKEALRLRRTAMVTALEEQGYDGIEYTNQAEDPGSTSYVAFRPEQIKSATGNRGTFSSSTGNIMGMGFGSLQGGMGKRQAPQQPKPNIGRVNLAALQRATAARGERAGQTAAQATPTTGKQRSPVERIVQSISRRGAPKSTTEQIPSLKSPSDELKELVAEYKAHPDRREALAPRIAELHAAESGVEAASRPTKIDKGGLGAPIGNAAKTAGDVLRTVRTSFDVSAPLTQGAMLSIAHPSKAAKSMVKMFQSIGERGAERIQKEIEASPAYALGKKYGLFTATEGHVKGENAPKEEAFANEWLNKQWGIRHSERTYRNYLDTLRLGVWEQYVNRLKADGITPESNPKAYEDAARAINIFSGRGALKRGGLLDKASPLMGALLFSPRNLVANFQALDPVRYYRMEKGARKLAIQDAVTAYGTMAGSAMLLAAAGANVGLDPTEDDFMQLRVGDTRVDLSMGKKTQVQFLARMLAGTANKVRGEGNLPGREPSMVAQRFIGGKSSPIVTTAKAIATGRDFKGEPVWDPKKSGLRNVAEFGVKNVAPMSAADFVEDAMEKRVGGMLSTPAKLLGARISTYPDRAKAAFVETGDDFRAEQKRHGFTRSILRPLTDPEKDRTKDETPEEFAGRRRRADGWQREYGSALVQSEEYKSASPAVQKKAIEIFQQTLTEQSQEVEPRTGLFDPSVIFGKAEKSIVKQPYKEERNTEKRAERRRRMLMER